MKVDEEPVIVSQEYPCSAARLWEAITDVHYMREWYFDNIPDFKAQVGFKTRFDVDTGERVFPHCWEVTEVDPGRRLVYRWQFAGFSGDSATIFEVSGDESSSRLTLTCEVYEDFPDDVPEFTRDSCLGGWKYFLNESLKAYLSKAPSKSI